MATTVPTTPFGTVPVVIFKRRDVRTGEPLEGFHVIIPRDGEVGVEAAKVHDAGHLELIAATSAVVHN